MKGFRYVAIDRVREFWDRRPCNIRHSPKPVGTREYFDEVEARKYRYVKVWYFRWMPKPLFRWLEGHFGWHLCVTAQQA